MADIKKLALLSRLEFTEEQEKAFDVQFENIIGFVDTISSVDTDGVEPLTSIMGDIPTPERADEVTESNMREAHQKNAPKAEMGFYVVPKIVE